MYNKQVTMNVLIDLTKYIEYLDLIGRDHQIKLTMAKNLIHKKIRGATITFNDLAAARFDNYHLDFWSAFTVPASKRNGYDNMIGNISTLINPVVNLPLPFFFSRAAALPYNEMQIFNFRDWNELLILTNGAPASPYVVGTHIASVSNEERRRMGCAIRDILIEYAIERLWKIGCTIRLSSRIGKYNTGRAKGVWAIKCYNSKDVDAHIQKLLADFKNDPKAPSEMYHGIKFTDLKEVAFIVNNYDASIDYINKFIKTRLEASLEEEDEVPPPLDYKRLTYQIGDHIETIDLEEEESDTDF
jgi:hypothetical protein